MRSRHNPQFLRPLRVPNQNTETTDLLAAMTAGADCVLTERATLDLEDLLQNNILDCEADFSQEDECNNEIVAEGFEPNDCVTIRTVQDIMQDLDELAAEPTAEQLIAAYYSKRLFNPKK